HRVRKDDSLVGQDVLKHGVVADFRTIFETEARRFTTADAEVQTELLDLPPFTLGEPPPLGCLIGKCGEDPGGRGGKRSVDVERAVNDTHLRISPSRSSLFSHNARRAAIHFSATA